MLSCFIMLLASTIFAIANGYSLEKMKNLKNTDIFATRFVCAHIIQNYVRQLLLTMDFKTANKREIQILSINFNFFSTFQTGQYLANEKSSGTNSNT